MTRSATVLALVAAVGVLGGCARQDGPPGPASGPTLSLSGASGVSADVRRTVSEVVAGSETVLSVVDTVVWAPFNDDGAAVAAGEAGAPGPVGWRKREAYAAAWSRYGSFVDSAGVLHELRVVADNPGPGTRIEYRRGGRVVVSDVATWAYVSGGWLVDRETVTYHLGSGSDVRIGLQGQQMNVARGATGIESFGLLAGVFHSWLAPRPLAAQRFYFSECSGDWLKWMGTALLAELAWGKFLKTKLPTDFRKGMAASAAAGVALSGLVDCMVEQPDQPDPGA